MNTRLQLPLLLAISALVTLPAMTAKADPIVTASPKAQRTAPRAKHNKQAAEKLCRQVKASKEFKTLGKADDAAAMADEICRFYAVPPAAKQKYWDQLLGRLVKADKLTKKDGRVLSKLLVAPSQTMEIWKPETPLGQTIRDLLQASDNGGSTPTANSTAGDVGTIAGALLGGLGGSPASVALGAALGKLAGEAANVLGQAAYDLAPDGGDGGGEDGGGEDGGGEDGGGEDGGE